MTPEEERIISRWGEGIGNDISLGVVWTEDEPGRKVRGFCRDLERLVPRLRIEDEEGEAESMPEIRVRDNVRYRAVPEAKELEPFLRILQTAEPLAEDLPPSLLELLKQVDVPASIRVYISPQCPFCPQVVMRCLALADANSSCHVLVIDGTLFPEPAEQDGVRSVPTVILDRAFRWTGSVESEDLVRMIAHRDPSQLSPDSLEQMLHEGRAEDLARMMIERGEVFPAFLDLLVNRKWPVRLGAMVTFQHLAESRAGLASQVSLTLWDLFPRVDDAIKGDILYLFGESGDVSFLPLLTSVVEGFYPDEVKEAAREAAKSLSEHPS
jgi:hypothetical protein